MSLNAIPRNNGYSIINDTTTKNQDSALSNFSLTELLSSINIIKDDVNNLSSELNYINGYAQGMAEIIGNDEVNLSAQWRNLSTIAEEIFNKFNDKSEYFFEVLDAYYKDSLENSSTWKSDVSKTQNGFDNIASALQNI